MTPARLKQNLQLQGENVDEKQRDTCLKILGCLIWADGQVTPQEEQKFAEFISVAGAIADQQIVLKYLQTEPEVSGDEISALPDDVFMQLITFSFEVVNFERPALDSEKQVLRQVAGCKFSEDKVEKLFEWFDHHKKASDLFDELFE